MIGWAIRRYRQWKADREQRRREREWAAWLAFRDLVRQHIEQHSQINSVARGDTISNHHVHVTKHAELLAEPKPLRLFTPPPKGGYDA